MVVVVLLVGALVLGLAVLRRRRRASLQALAWSDPATQCEAIYHHLCCYEFPWECFCAINFAFYRAFCSPTIAKLYHSTGHIAKDASKRVADTDILMHAWIDFGIDSDEGRASWEHLNRLHGVWKNRMNNNDFVYVLCCFIVDTIRFINVFGWRPLTKLESEGIFHFWAKLGLRMGIERIPESLAEASAFVQNYINSDATAKETQEGRLLADAMMNLMWYWFVPPRLVSGGMTALLCVIGGATFVKKMGLTAPAPLTLRLLLSLGRLRAVVVSFLPARSRPRRLSQILMQAHYPMHVALSADHNKPQMDFGHVGPVNLVTALQS
jgi:hypothetical protein